MKKSKQRVVAIDYFRGIFILAVLLNHSAIFSSPFTYLAGDGILWTTAAEMFLLLSGITLWIVRGEQLTASFKSTSIKIWQRAAKTYLIYVVTVILSLTLALYLVSHSLTNDVLGNLPQTHSLQLLINKASPNPKRKHSLTCCGRDFAKRINGV
jgi:hypothetical protein